MRKYVIAVLAMLAIYTSNAQSGDIISKAAVVQALDLDITFHKTSFLIFPAPIQSADRGDSYVLAEKVKGSENVLKVKAAQKNFEPSNLQVITTDGKIYAFNVGYADQPSALTIDLRKQPPYAPVSFGSMSLNSAQMERCASLARSQPFLKSGTYRRHKMRLQLRGVYIKEDAIFLLYHLKNQSQIRYDLASVRFFVRDKKKMSRTASQDREVTPVYVQQTGKPEDPAGQYIVAAFPKFTIAEKKNFIAELMEKDGDRNPSSKLDQRRLLKARTLQ